MFTGKHRKPLLGEVRLTRGERAEIRAWKNAVLRESTRNAYNLGLAEGIRIERKRQERERQEGEGD